jgi:hypothetical protein
MAPPRALVDDGRQSDAARALQRGASRRLVSMGFAPLTEVTLASGRRADIVAIGAAQEIWIGEIKSSLADFRSDQKWPEYREYCDRLLFVVAPEFPLAVLPEDAGLIVADRYGGEIIRTGGEHKLGPARRKAVVQHLARVACLRLQALSDPDLKIEDATIIRIA